MSDVESPCGGCGKTCGSGTVQCQACDNWWHPKCAGMKKGLLDCILKSWEECGAHVWCCRVCASVKDELKKQVLCLQVNFKQLEKVVDENTKGVKTNKDNVETIRSELDLVKTDTAKIASMESALSIVQAAVLNIDKAKLVTEVSEMSAIEHNERKYRDKNIVIYNFQEPPASIMVGKLRKEEDSKAIDVLFKDMKNDMSISENVLKFARLGEKKDDKSRPLLISFKKIDEKNKMFSTAKNLKNNSKYVKMSITPDVTKQQRREDILIEKEAEELNNKRTPEEAKNWEWKLRGLQGEKTMFKLWYPLDRGLKRGREREEIQDKDMEQEESRSPPRKH